MTKRSDDDCQIFIMLIIRKSLNEIMKDLFCSWWDMPESVTAQKY